MSQIKWTVGVGALLIAGLVYSQNRVTTDPQAFIDELMASVLSAEPPPPLNLPLVPTNVVLESATFWSAQASGESAPWPYNPVADLGLPLYSLGNNSYLFDDRAVNYAAWNQVQSALRQLASGGGMTMNSLEFPGDGEGTNENGGWTNNYESLVFGTNDLWVELDPASLTNGTLNLLLHVPEFYTNAVWDVFATTNLNLDFPGLNGTNWTWVARTGSGVTNLTVPLLSDYQTYYRIANTNDLDGDGLTDAFEALVSHSSATTNDTDGDGMFDGWEWQHGLNLNNAADASDDPDGDWLTNLQEYNGGTNSTNPHDVMVLAWGLPYGDQLSVPGNLRNVAAVDGGLASSLALRADGSVAGWGSGASSLPNWTNATQLSVTADQVAIVKLDGTVSLLKTNYGLPPANLTNAVQVAAGDRFCLALSSDSTVTAWGTNNAGQSTVPTNLPTAKAVAAGWEHSVVLLQDGTVRSWGQKYGGFGWNVTNVPAGLSNVVAIAAGGFHTLALKADGTVAAWGAGLLTNESSYMDAQKGQSVVPPGLSNVVAVSAGGYHSMALKADGNVVVWGDLGSFPYADAQGQIAAINSGELHGLALRSGRLLPLIMPQPTDQAALPGETAQFAVMGFGLADVHYQWQFNSVDLSGETNTTLTLTNVSTSEEGTYRVIVSTGAGSVFSSNALFQLVTPPIIASQSMPTNPVLIYQTNVMLSVAATAPGQFAGFPLSYQWQLNGTNIAGVTSSNYTFMVNNSGTYSVLVSNVVGGTNAAWQVAITYEGSYMAEGTLAHHLSTNAVGYAAGYSGSSVDKTVVSGWTYATYTNENMALLTNAVWSTNCWLKGVRGLSATCIGYTNGVGGQALKTMVSPRHYLYATHTPASQPVAFLDTNNIIHWRHALQQVDLANDTSVGILDEDLPASVGYLPVIPKDFTNYLPTTSFSFVQGIGMNQDLRLFSQPMLLGDPDYVNWNSGTVGAAPLGLGPNWDIEIRGGDSSAPGMFLVHNQLVLATHNYGAGGGPNYAYQFDAINQLMHYLSTNNTVGTDYQLTPFSLTNWPAIH